MSFSVVLKFTNKSNAHINRREGTMMIAIVFEALS